MTCESAGRAIPLYYYGELAAPEEEQLEEHLASCSGCREELERHRVLSETLTAHRVPDSPALLEECRRELMSAVRMESQQRQRPRESRPNEAWAMLRQGLAGLLMPVTRLRVPLGAVTLVALGYFSARLTTDRPVPGNLAGFAPEPVISAVRSVQPDASGRVQIAVDETRRRVISGGLDDGTIQRLLLAAARDENNPAVRVESIDVLKSRPASDEIRAVLLFAAARDPNPGVRLKALEGLKPFASEPEVRKTLAQLLLEDENPGVRIQAIDMLMQHRDGSVVGVLQNVVERENNSYVRLKCEKALRDMNASIGTF